MYNGGNVDQKVTFVLHHGQLKAFKTSVLTLFKAGGGNLMVVADETSLRLSSCNSSRSCYVSLDLSSLFFASYEYQCDHGNLKAMFPFKNILPIFRTSKVRLLKFTLMLDINVLIATLECEKGLMKEYRILFSEDEPMVRPLVLDRHEASLPAVWFDTSDATSFSKILSTIHVNSAADLVTISYDAHDNGLKLCSECGVQLPFDTGNEVQKDALHTILEMNNSIGQFGAIRNSLGTSTKVSFNLKDFLGLVNTAESLHCDLSLHFSIPGQPLLASCNPTKESRLEMILATLHEAENQTLNVLGSALPEHSLGQPAGEVNPIDLAEAFVHDGQDVIASTPPQSPERNGGHSYPGMIM
jgi:hypothetical protein